MLPRSESWIKLTVFLRDFKDDRYYSEFVTEETTLTEISEDLKKKFELETVSYCTSISPSQDTCWMPTQQFKR